MTRSTAGRVMTGHGYNYWSDDNDGDDTLEGRGR